MHRFYLPPSQCQDKLLTLEGTEAHHALRVLRLKIGEAVSVLDGAGRELSCVVQATHRNSVDLQAVKIGQSPAPSCKVTLIQAVPKGKLFDTIIQKATELGASRIIPLLSERVATRLQGESVNHKEEKWQQTAIEAIKQCGQRWLPQVDAPITLPALLARKDHYDLSLVGSLRDDARHPDQHLAPQLTGRMAPPASIGVWIGPEGDFTDAELEAIRGAGALPISLGPLVLRSDTAAIYTLSIVSYKVQSWRILSHEIAAS